jgi:hypothetical protein
VVCERDKKVLKNIMYCISFLLGLLRFWVQFWAGNCIHKQFELIREKAVPNRPEGRYSAAASPLEPVQVRFRH